MPKLNWKQQNIVIQNIPNYGNYDCDYIIASERMGVLIAKRINKTCRAKRIGIRARVLFPGVVMEFNRCYRNRNVD